MKAEEFETFVKILTEDRQKVAKGKRKDYTKDSPDVLANFKNQAEYLGITEYQSLGVHMEKQISAVFNYIKNDGTFEIEPIIKRIGDSINYLELLWGLIKERESGKLDSNHMVNYKSSTTPPLDDFLKPNHDERIEHLKETGRSLGI